MTILTKCDGIKGVDTYDPNSRDIIAIHVLLRVYHQVHRENKLHISIRMHVWGVFMKGRVVKYMYYSHGRVWFSHVLHIFRVHINLVVKESF